jgi:hypothetical protein
MIQFISYVSCDVAGTKTKNGKNKVWAAGSFCMLSDEQLTMLRVDGGGMFDVSEETLVVPATSTEPETTRLTKRADYVSRPALALVAQNRMLDQELSVADLRALCGL